MNSVRSVPAFNIVVSFEPVQLIVSLASEQVIEPACAEDLLIVIVANPFETSDVPDFKSTKIAGFICENVFVIGVGKEGSVIGVENFD